MQGFLQAGEGDDPKERDVNARKLLDLVTTNEILTILTKPHDWD